VETFKYDLLDGRARSENIGKCARLSDYSTNPWWHQLRRILALLTQRATTRMHASFFLWVEMFLEEVNDFGVAKHFVLEFYDIVSLVVKH